MLTHDFLEKWRRTAIIIEILEDGIHEANILLKWKDEPILSLEEIQEQILETNKSGDIQKTRSNIKKWSSIIQQALETLETTYSATIFTRSSGTWEV